MKRVSLFLVLLMLAVFIFTACALPPFSQQSGDTSSEAPIDTSSFDTSSTVTSTAPVSTEPPRLVLAEEGKSEYRVILADSLYRDSDFRAAVGEIFSSISADLVPGSDRTVKGAREILVGNTNRTNPSDVDGFYYSVITVEGERLSVSGDNPEVLLEALNHLAKTYVENGVFSLPVTVEDTVLLDRHSSEALEKSYEEIAKEIYDSFNTKYFEHGWVEGHAFWDKAEMLEVYIDAYEATGSKEAKDKLVSYAKMFEKLYHADWSRNEYNDDIMWACIGFARMSKLLNKEVYLTYAKDNFDKVWERAYDEVLGGGLYWRIENTTKNSCVNCPGAIAACLIAEMTGDRSYYDKAKLLMDWEFDNMFEPKTGRVYDAFDINGNINKWASTYNQGTFIGACTLLDQAFGDEEGGEIYLQYAAKAAEYAMTKLVNQAGIIDNGEASLSNRDLPGFKGILVRWLYRYAKYTENLDILAFLQKNADQVYQMKNADGIVWTDWTKRTPAPATINGNANYVVFGMSTAVSLVYNCQPWW